MVRKLRLITVLIKILQKTFLRWIRPSVKHEVIFILSSLFISQGEEESFF